LCRREYGHLLLSLPPSTLAVTAITEVLSQVMQNPRPDLCVSWANVAVSIGRQVEMESILWSHRQDRVKWRRLMNVTQQQADSKGVAASYRLPTILGLSDQPWTVQQRTLVGSALLELLVPAAK
jgi:uncharacterized protein with NAD-binding domain and iron-sulfur cluster